MLTNNINGAIASSEKNLLTTSQVANYLNTSNKVILENAKKYLPNKKIAKKPNPTYWNEKEITILLEGLKGNNPNQNQFTGAVNSINTSLTPALKIKRAMELMQEGYQEELDNLKLQNQKQRITIDDFELASKSRQSKKALKARIVTKVRELAKGNGNYQEVFRELYRIFDNMHNGVNYYDKKNKLTYLIDHGYGDELLEILLINF